MGIAQKILVSQKCGTRLNTFYGAQFTLRMIGLRVNLTHSRQLQKSSHSIVKHTSLSLTSRLVCLHNNVRLQCRQDSSTVGARRGSISSRDEKTSQLHLSDSGLQAMRRQSFVTTFAFCPFHERLGRLPSPSIIPDTRGR